MSVHPSLYEAVENDEKGNELIEEGGLSEVELAAASGVAGLSLDNKSLVPDNNENEMYEVKYYTRQACTALVIHLIHFVFGPFALLPLRWLFGKPLVANMMFRCNTFYLVGELCIWFWTLLTISELSFSKNLGRLWMSMFSAALAISIRTMLLSLKYGYYTKKYWNSLNSRLHSEDELTKNFLLLSWLQIPRDLLEREINFSYRRLTFNPNNHFLKFKELANVCKDMIKQHSPYTLDLDDRTVPLLNISQYLASKTAAGVKVHEKKLVTVIAAGYALLPWISDYSLYTSSEVGWFPVFYMVLSSLLSFLHIRGFLLFILVGVYDFSRKKALMAQCTALISHEDQAYLYFNGHSPKLDLEHAQTTIAWYYMRTAFLDFGKRYTLRIFLYTSLVMPVCLSVIACIVLMALGIIHTVYLYFFVSGVYLVVAVTFILVYMVSAAVSLNRYFAIHRDILLTRMTELRSADPSGDGVSQNVTHTLWVVIEKLNQDEILHPATVMGIKLDSSLYAKLGALVGSGVIALLRLLVGS